MELFEGEISRLLSAAPWSRPVVLDVLMRVLALLERHPELTAKELEAFIADLIESE